MVWRVRTEFVGVQGAPWLSTMLFGTVNSAQQSVNAVGAFWSAVDAAIATAVTWRTLPDVDEIDVDGNLIGVESTTVQTAGGALAGDRLPHATQALITWRTGAIIGGRELKGRTFIPGIGESHNSADGTLSSGLISILQAAGDALIADVNSAFTIWSPTHAQVRLATVASVRDQWAVLRSRRD